MDTPESTTAHPGLPAKTQPNSTPAIRRRKSKKITEAKFAPCLKVTLADRTVVMIPVDKLSCDAQRQILIAKARAFLEGHLVRLASVTLTPAEIKDTLKAIADLDGLQREQYLAELNEKATSRIGKGIQEVVRQAAQGAAEGTSAGFLARMKQLDAAAAKVEAEKKVIPI